MVYSSTDNQKIKDLKKLHNKKYRDKAGLFLVEGDHLVLEAYKKGCLKELIVENDEDFSLDVDTMRVTNNVIKYLSEVETPQKVIGLCEKKEKINNIGSKVLMLDGLQDPGNLGTIIRSAVAFNIDTLILSDDAVDVYNSKVIRASQGMLFSINIIRKNLLEIIPDLKKDGYIIIGTDVNDGKSIKKIEKNEKFVIIMGNEGNGLKKEVFKLCDEFINIDMNEACESLNVGVATSIILYEMDK